MNTVTRLGAYGLVLVVVFAAALGIGRLTGEPDTPAPTHEETGQVETEHVPENGGHG